MKKSAFLRFSTLFCLLSLQIDLFGQKFYFGSDLSYTNEMQDCGAVFKENNTAIDPFDLFAKHGTNLARFRLWHTPSFYDTLNAGKRYSDLADVRRSIVRVKAAGMDVLLDFHLSDFWADPSRQLIPKAWEPVANNLPVLKDSLYNYVYTTLLSLHTDNLLPELVQIGNETNKGIMLSPSVDAAGWSLDWARNAALFNIAIKAVRDIETATGKNIRVALHIADPSDCGWLMQGFWANGVQDFDIIGISYYWAWHKPVTIAQTGTIIQQLRTQYPGKSVMIFETGYIWTQASNDGATNIITETHPSYAPASPANQRKWLTDLTQEVINKGGEAVMYWEPAWVSTPCRTPWGQGSHQEHATFFDFDENMLPLGGMTWPKFPYTNLTQTTSLYSGTPNCQITPDYTQNRLQIQLQGLSPVRTVEAHFFNQLGQSIGAMHFDMLQDGNGTFYWNWPPQMHGIVFVTISDHQGTILTEKVYLR